MITSGLSVALYLTKRKYIEYIYLSVIVRYYVEFYST